MTDPVSAIRSSESSLHAKVDMVMSLCAEQRDDMRTFAIHLRDHATAVHDQYATLRADLAKTTARTDEHSGDFEELSQCVTRLSDAMHALERVEIARGERLRVAKQLASWGAGAIGVISTGAGVLAALGLR